MPPRILVGVASCWADRRYHEQIRETWAADPPDGVEVRFFMGWPEPELVGRPWDLRQDRPGTESVLDCPDGYGDLRLKVQRMCTFALADGFDWLFKCDTDTFVCLPRLAALLAGVPADREPRKDYGGWTGPFWPLERNAAHGGPGYWLSRRAMEAVARFEPPTGVAVPEAEDWFVYEVLGTARIRPRHDDRFSVFTPPCRGNSAVTWHPADKRTLDRGVLEATVEGLR